MKFWDRHAKFDEMQTLEHEGWRFLCSGEQLPSGLFHAVVRYKVPPGSEIRTLVLDYEKFDTSAPALEHAKELAIKWAGEHPGWTTH